MHPNVSQQVEARHLRHFQVEQQQVGPLLFEGGQGVDRLFNQNEVAVARLLQIGLDHFHGGGLVIHNDDAGI